MQIRKAETRDLSRIAEILVFVKRINYRPIFQNDAYSFGELQVLNVARQYAAPEILGRLWVYDDGIVKGLIHIEGEEIRELYVDHFFQGQGIGAQLIEFAKERFLCRHLWALEKNTAAIRFYRRHGFFSINTRKLEEGTTEWLVLLELCGKALYYCLETKQQWQCRAHLVCLWCRVHTKKRVFLRVLFCLCERPAIGGAALFA